MNRLGKKYLLAGGALEIAAGIISIVLIRFLLHQDEKLVLFSNEVAHDALWGLVYIYGVNAFKILAGVIALICANKKSMLSVVLGILLFFAHGFAFLAKEQTLAELITNLIMILPAYFYLSGAIKNLRSTNA
ncbi:hypothetical protein [Massilicoli timonensis]|uniref:DoxX family protein n=2 Tax=Massilicoli timonensis TaxID=2015901 RepID=A0ABT1SML4_9FIRM|nr:hypothetical protein [Massilicoli timonensis]MCQ5122443.1 hypothetical protein [Massilicoli timonensis]